MALQGPGVAEEAGAAARGGIHARAVGRHLPGPQGLDPLRRPHPGGNRRSAAPPAVVNQLLIQALFDKMRKAGKTIRTATGKDIALFPDVRRFKAGGYVAMSACWSQKRPPLSEERKNGEAWRTLKASQSAFQLYRLRGPKSGLARPALDKVATGWP